SLGFAARVGGEGDRAYEQHECRSEAKLFHGNPFWVDGISSPAFRRVSAGGRRYPTPNKTRPHRLPDGALSARPDGQEVTRPCFPCHPGVAPFRQSLMNALRSSPFFSAALVLQTFIFSCCVSLAGSLPERHALKNALRSSPFLSPALALQSFIRSCCALV